MPEIIAWQPNDSSGHVLRHLAAGGCAGLPTESTYELVGSALNPQAVAGLRRLAPQDRPLPIVLSDYRQLFDWLPLLGGAGARLYRRMGPGPLTLQADAGFVHGLWSRLPAEVRVRIAHEGQVAVRWPGHPIWNELRQADLPLVSINLGSGSNVEEFAGLAPADALLVDAGATQYHQPPTIARADQRRCQILQGGGLSRADFDQLTMCRIVFLCTGNTCRSPMASGLCAKLLADQLGCAPSDLERHGFCVESAGLAARMDAEAAPDAMRVAAEHGADITSHRSRMVTLEMLLGADYIFAMTAGHWYTIKSIPAADMPEPRLLSPQDEDVADPIGGELADYRACASHILACLQRRLPELLES